VNGRHDRHQTEGDDHKFVTLGRISGLFGVRGWVKIHSDTDPREGILRYSPWYLRREGHWEERRPEQGQRQGKGVVAKIEGCEDRDAAAGLMGAVIAVRRDQLPGGLHPGEYYWADLEGLQVVTTAGVELGRVDHLLETGANDVLVVRGDRERLIPYLWQQVVLEVDLEQRRLLVDWDPDF